MPSLTNRIIYQALRGPAMAAYLLGFSYRFQGGANIPRTGPALLIANHESFLDPLAIGLTTTRPLHYLARKTLFRGLFGNLLTRINAVPVDQEGVAKEGLRTIIELIEAGNAVVVFPEGERTLTGQMIPLKPGIQLIIRRTMAPIVPIGISGASDAMPREGGRLTPSPLFMPASRGAIAIAVGRPMKAEPFVEMERGRMLTELGRSIQEMKDEAYRIRRKP